MNIVQRIFKEHLREGSLTPGSEVGIAIDQVLVQDTTGTLAFLLFESMGIDRVRAQLVSVHADHQTYQFSSRNSDDHHFLQTAARRYGCWFSRPGNGICHQVHNERFSRPGETLLGADSHTQHQGGVGMVAIGAGGLDAAVAMAGGTYYVRLPAVVQVWLSGQLGPWVTAKEVTFELLRRLTASGGKGKAFEFAGPGVAGLTAPQRCTITNLCTELGATTSIFPSDEVTHDYFRRLGREGDWRPLAADPDAEYDERIEIDLDGLEPMVACPSLPDRIRPVREVAGTPIQQVFLGSCTNGQYSDILPFARILQGRRVHPDVSVVITPSSKQAAELLARDGWVASVMAAGVSWSESTCGPCIGVGHVPAAGTNSLRVINRNFQGRSGLEDDHVYLSSPEVAAVAALRGQLVDPRDTDIPAPGYELAAAYDGSTADLLPPAAPGETVEVVKGPWIGTLPEVPRPARSPRGSVLLKVGDDISTDHIMPARGDILQWRSNVAKLAEFTMARLDPGFAARARERGGGWIVGGANYGQGSSREHAALCPAILGVRGVIARSFARIHKSNLINYSVLPLEFADPRDYDAVQPDDDLELPDALELVRGGDEGRVTNHTRGTSFAVRLEATERERRILEAGGSMRLGLRQGGPGQEARV